MRTPLTKNWLAASTPVPAAPSTAPAPYPNGLGEHRKALRGVASHRRAVLILGSNSVLDGHMARIAGRQARSGVADQEPLRVRVSPENSQKVDRAAAALGISKAAYVDALLSRECLDSRGRPIWWTDPAPTDQEELPLTQTA